MSAANRPLTIISLTCPISVFVRVGLPLVVIWLEVRAMEAHETKLILVYVLA